MGDMNAASMKKSSTVATKAGNSLQHSAQAVVPHSIATDSELSKKRLIVLMALFQALLDNTYSPDVRELSLGAAVSKLRGVMNPEEVEEIGRQLLGARRKQIMDSMF
jgi:hypothetical protein